MVGISSLYTAMSGLHAHRRILDVTAHNVANQATPGYHRQRVELSPAGISSVNAIFAGQSTHVAGVDVDDVTRVMDLLAENRLLRETAAQAGTSTMQSTMVQIERAFPEPSEDGLAGLLGEFWAGWSDVALQPTDGAARSQLLSRAQNLADGLHQAAADVKAVSTAAQEEIVRLGVRVNDLATRIAELNQAVSASTTPANDLRDQRDILLTELTELTGATAREQDNGQIDVAIAGRAIVTSTYVHAVDGSTGALTWANDGSAVLAPPSRAASLARTVDEVVPRYLSMLDDVADRLVNEVNTLHAAGYDPSGATGWNFFDPAGTSAATISIGADLLGHPERVAAGAPVLPGPTAPGALDGEQARTISALMEAPMGPDAQYRSMVAALGVETRGAMRRADVQNQVTNAAAVDAESVGGVSLDEEMANLVSAQRGYEANARVLTAVDEMLGVLINRTGVVGR
jgi:flagellar hook-associated protein 1 FlgK